MNNVIDMVKKGVKGDKRRLSSASDLRLFLAALIRQVDADQISESKARVLTYMCQTLMGIIRDNDIEQRVTALEKERGKDATGKTSPKA